MDSTCPGTNTIGVPLSDLSANLIRVAPEFAKKPIRSFDAIAAMGDHVRDYMLGYHESLDVEEHTSHLPYEAFDLLTPDQLAKTLVSAKHSIPSEMRDRFEVHPTQRLVAKIRSSMWRWGMRNDDWNAVVDAYDAIRSFDLGVPGFTVTLDHTSYYNERGRGVHCRRWLDGVFAFLVHWKGEHVMTLGFSVTGDRGVLIQQIQTTKRTGNRWLFRFPANRTEYIIDRFAAAFTGHALHIVDGADVAGMYLKGYRETKKGHLKTVADYERRLERGVGVEDDILGYIADEKAKAAALAEKIRHLAKDRPRLSAIYADTGRYARGAVLKMNDFRHYALAA